MARDKKNPTEQLENTETFDQSSLIKNVPDEYLKSQEIIAQSKNDIWKALRGEDTEFLNSIPDPMEEEQKEIENIQSNNYQEKNVENVENDEGSYAHPDSLIPSDNDETSGHDEDDLAIDDEVERKAGEYQYQLDVQNHYQKYYDTLAQQHAAIRQSYEEQAKKLNELQEEKLRAYEEELEHGLTLAEEQQNFEAKRRIEKALMEIMVQKQLNRSQSIPSAAPSYSHPMHGQTSFPHQPQYNPNLASPPLPPFQPQNFYSPSNLRMPFDPYPNLYGNQRTPQTVPGQVPSNPLAASQGVQPPRAYVHPMNQHQTQQGLPSMPEGKISSAPVKAKARSIAEDKKSPTIHPFEERMLKKSNAFKGADGQPLKYEDRVKILINANQ
jgi:hypothetical protein